MYWIELPKKRGSEGKGQGRSITEKVRRKCESKEKKSEKTSSVYNTSSNSKMIKQIHDDGRFVLHDRTQFCSEANDLIFDWKFVGCMRPRRCR